MARSSWIPRCGLPNEILKSRTKKLVFTTGVSRNCKSDFAKTPGDRDAQWELGRAYASLNQYDLAVEQFQGILQLDPHDVAAMTQIGLAEKRRGNLDDAVEWFTRAVELDDNSSVGHFYRGEALYNQGAKTESLRSLERSVKLNPDNAEAHYLIAFLLGDLGRHEEAREATNHAIRLNPSFGRVQTNLSLEPYIGDRASAGYAIPDDIDESPNTPDLMPHYNLGVAFRSQGYLADALREFRLALDHGEDRRRVLEAVAEVSLLKRDYSAALDLYDSLLRETPNGAKLWNERGVVLHQLGRFNDALQSYREALHCDDRYGLANNNLGVTLAHTNRTGDALSAFRGAMQVQPDVETPVLNLGKLLLSCRRMKVAAQTYRQVIDRNPAARVEWPRVGNGGARSARRCPQRVCPSSRKRF